MLPILAFLWTAAFESQCSAEVSAETLLQQAIAKVRALPSYTVEFVRYDDSSNSHSVVHHRIHFVAPSLYHIDELEPWKQSVRASDGHVDHIVGCTKLSQIYNGKTRWMYSVDRKQYLQFDSLNEDAKVEFFPSPLPYPEVEYLPDETLLLEGHPRQCAVIRARRSGGREATFWIDPAQGLIVKWMVGSRGSNDGLTVEITSMDTHPVLSDSLFRFEPESDWQKTTAFSCPGQANLPAQKTSDR